VLEELRSDPPVALRPLPSHGRLARVAIVQSSATLLAGDDVSTHVRVGPGARLELVEISATLCHPGPAERPILQRIEIDVRPGGLLMLDEQPLIVSAGSHLRRTTRIRLHGDGRCLHREALVLGREGERPGAASVRTRVERDGTPILDEAIDTTQLAVLRSPAVLGKARYVSSAGLWGAAPGELPARALALGPGDTVLRGLGVGAIDGQPVIDSIWPRWREALLQDR
jgi:urease accessory protein